MHFTHFISYAIFRAKNGCFGLAIQDNCAVHASVTLSHFDLSVCSAHEAEQNIASIVKFNMPVHIFVLL